MGLPMDAHGLRQIAVAMTAMVGGTLAFAGPDVGGLRKDVQLNGNAPQYEWSSITFTDSSFEGNPPPRAELFLRDGMDWSFDDGSSASGQSTRTFSLLPDRTMCSSA
jgi:hypothetical protein